MHPRGVCTLAQGAHGCKSVVPLATHAMGALALPFFSSVVHSYVSLVVNHALLLHLYYMLQANVDSLCDVAQLIDTA